MAIFERETVLNKLVLKFTFTFEEIRANAKSAEKLSDYVLNEFREAMERDPITYR